MSGSDQNSLRNPPPTRMHEGEPAVGLLEYGAFLTRVGATHLVEAHCALEIPLAGMAVTGRRDDQLARVRINRGARDGVSACAAAEPQSRMVIAKPGEDSVLLSASATTAKRRSPRSVAQSQRLARLRSPSGSTKLFSLLSGGRTLKRARPGRSSLS